MDFGLNESQPMLKKSACEFLDKKCPNKLVRAMMEDEEGYSPEPWKKMADVGWQGLVFPEKYGALKAVSSIWRYSLRRCGVPWYADASSQLLSTAGGLS